MNSFTKISGAEAPDEIPIVEHFLILSNGILLSECISSVYLQLLDTNSGAREETYNTIKEAVKLVN